MTAREILTGARIFDGARMIDGHALVIEEGEIAAILPEAEAPAEGHRAVTGILAPAFLDLQVNGGGGLMLDGRTDLAGLRRICAAHRGLGTAGVLPTLITDTPAATAHVVALGIAAARAQVPGFLGLHLEGPHLDPRRKGAHDPALIRPMDEQDLARLCEAARQLPALMVTLAPEAASPRQIAALAGAGAIVSLGHSDCSHDAAQAAFAAGARCATHLFNAMSQIGHRAPGLAGALLSGDARAGLIADGIHVHPAAMRLALAARPEGLFLVTDCMAFAGTDLTEMELGGRQILRRDGRLTLADGTLAGADLTLPQAVANLVRLAGIAPERALRMATAEPAALLGLQASHGALAPGRRAEFVLLDRDFALREYWL
ncbi:N-acetylglucosamine-6-phosphate deacetylase [Paracoccus aminovorans]|uniref:N-acetylglucosamine-6-phosphate deacetylase n=1 Tax=Paracoccus aminovorans TaxID=34004 RepID=UPI002B260C36|nr:N-acetylglucosamine-6-phosphate deacetylase [Paracoccus aminovorans]